jgi:adenosylcobinamide kinase / adenosylcobinamide-phosphate guanylyltransferase
MILVTGGARSGKSATAERLATGLAAEWAARSAPGSPAPGGRVLYVASAEARDEEMARRIARHQARRPAHWGTLEAPSRAISRLQAAEGRWDCLLFDCLTLYISNLLLAAETPPAVEAAPGTELEDRLLTELGDLARYLRTAWPRSVVVTNEVGSGIVPGDPLSRLFQDLQGMANQAFARESDEVYLCACGIPLRLKPSP